MANPVSHEPRVPRGRQIRPAADSPTYQRSTDDLLSSLTPRAAVEAFRNPAGTLKKCMDMATPAEQAFALRAAIASKNIQEWLEELSAWPWPSGGGSAGFEMPVAKRRRLSLSDVEPDAAVEQDEPHSLDKYYGSVLAADVARYERRIDEISRSMEDLDVEEIKSQVLHNHIMPLSRPGSPMLDTSRSVTSSLAAYAKMDDLTALITATLMQALPNLSRLTRLMNSWTLRLLVLKKIPVFLTSLADAEIALRSGWNAINSSCKADHDRASQSPSISTLSRKEFDIMKSILQRKVAKSGRDLDVMLDMLEGREDTLPEDWIDRVDTLEQQYGEWTVASERKIREADWARSMRQTTPGPVVQPETENQPGISRSGSLANASVPLASTLHTHEDDAVSPTGTESNSVESEQSAGEFSQGPSEPSETLTPLDTSLGLREDSPPPLIKVHLPPGEPDTQESGHDSSPESDIPGESERTGHIAKFDGTSVNGNGKLTAVDDDIEDWPSLAEDDGRHAEDGDQEDYQPNRPDSELDFEDLGETEIPQPDLPLLPRPRRDSDISNPSTVVHGLQSGLMDFSSDQLEHGTPELPRIRDSDLDVIPSDDLSPEGSPQVFRSSTRSLSVSFNDMPTVAEIPDDESCPRTPFKSSFLEDDLSRDFGSPGKASATNSDDQLQQQISEILESVPAKIRLKAEPSAINLNPPDFTMPTRKTPKPDPHPRSQSSLSTVSNMSSRAGTPSFTLAPAYNRNNRNRPQRGNQEIKLYHLSRSNGEAPIKLFIRCVGEHGERVMVRVGGGWADLGEYLKEYASHHGRRSGQSKVEIKDLPSVKTRATSTPPTRPQSAQETYSPITPLHIRKTRKSAAVEDVAGGSTLPKTPLASVAKPDTPSPGDSTQSRSSSRLSWTEEDSSLGMAGPRAKHIEMSEESKAWVESVKEKVRIASGERKVSEPSAAQVLMDGKFGEMGKVGATKRLFRRQG